MSVKVLNVPARRAALLKTRILVPMEFPAALNMLPVTTNRVWSEPRPG